MHNVTDCMRSVPNISWHAIL